MHQLLHAAGGWGWGEGGREEESVTGWLPVRTNGDAVNEGKETRMQIPIVCVVA